MFLLISCCFLLLLLLLLPLLLFSFRSSLDPSNIDTKPSFNAFGSLSNSTLSTPLTKSSSSITTPALNPSSNPFAGFTGLAKLTPKVDQPSITQPPAKFSTITPAKTFPTNITSSSLSSTSSNSLSNLLNSKTTSSVSISSSSSSTSTTSTTLTSSNLPKSKIEKLNKTFSAWLEKQLLDNPISDWSGGLQVLRFLFIYLFVYLFD